MQVKTDISFNLEKCFILLASMMIHSDAKRGYDVSSSLTGIENLPG
jgi:hypothetical protein